MTQDMISRRKILVGAMVLVAASPLRALAQRVGPAIHVMKDPSCGCCSAWIDILEQDGFAVTTEDSLGEGFLMRVAAERIALARQRPALGNLPRRKPRGSWIDLWGKSAVVWGDGCVRGSAEGAHDG